MPDQRRINAEERGLRLFGLIGFPLTHSFSKKYFDQKFLEIGLPDCSFENFPLESILDFPHIIEQHKNLCGLSVTIPHKRSVIDFLHEKKDIPAELNACNCIRIKNGILSGYNTDHIGFENS